MIDLNPHSVIVKEERNMGNIRRSLFGYKKREVDDLISRLEGEKAHLEQELEGKSEMIEQLNAQLHKFRSQEELVREAIIDAKQLSKRLVEEAKQEATELLCDANKTISDEFARFNQSMETLNGIKNRVVAQKEELSKELQETLRRYKESFENSETEDFVRIKEELDADITRSEEVVEKSKQVIFLPSFNKSNWN